MEKPINIRVKEIEETMVNLINESNIPAFIMKNVIEKIYNQLVKLEQKELEISMSEWQKEVKKDGTE